MEHVPYDALRDIHKGERLVVAGTGPSLGDVADKVNTQLTIGVNRAPEWIRPRYLLFWDLFSAMPEQ